MAVNRDTLKTIGGLVVIALIIVAAFLYGDAQHQNQVRQNQTAKTQTSSSPAVVQAPAKPSAAPRPASPTPKVSSMPAPATPGQGGITTTPQTGAASDLLPLAVLAGVWVLYRRSLPQRAAKAVTALR